MKTHYWIYTPDQFENALSDYLKRRIDEEPDNGNVIIAGCEIARDFMASPEARKHGLLVEQEIKIGDER